MPIRGIPVTVRGLVMHHQHEGLILVAFVLEPVQGPLGNHVRHVAPFVVRLAFGGDEVRVVVLPLSGQHFPVVEALHHAGEVDLADHHGLVAVLLQDFLKLLLVMVEAVTVGVFAVHVTVLAGQQRGATGSADRVPHVATIEANAVAGDAIDVGGGVERLQASTVGSDGLVGVIVAEDPDDVGSAGGRRQVSQRQCQGCGYHYVLSYCFHMCISPAYSGHQYSRTISGLSCHPELAEGSPAVEPR